MTIISCYECKAQISDSAKSCPKCGAPQEKLVEPKRSHRTLNIAIGLVLVPFVLLAILMVLNVFIEANMSPEEKRQRAQANAEQSELGEAKRYCRQGVELLLKSRSSAKFSDQVQVQRLGSEIEVSGHVEAQNSFGAMINNLYVCHVRRGANGQMEFARLIRFAQD